MILSNRICGSLVIKKYKYEDYTAVINCNIMVMEPDFKKGENVLVLHWRGKIVFLYSKEYIFRTLIWDNITITVLIFKNREDINERTFPFSEHYYHRLDSVMKHNTIYRYLIEKTMWGTSICKKVQIEVQ